MFWRKKAAPPPPSPPSEHDIEEMKRLAMAGAISAQKANDPLIGVKIGAKELFAQCMAAVHDDRGVHVETLLCVLGAISGFACPAAIAEQLALKGLTPPQVGIMVVEGADGRTYWFGDPVNHLLTEDQYAVWPLIAGKAQALGVTHFSDAANAMQHVAATVGGADFGIPRLPEGHRPALLPIDAARAIWPAAHAIMIRYCDEPREWPLLAALAAQEGLETVRDSLDPALAATILLECAFPMAKLAPGSLGLSQPVG
jgi:hypothetical protein